MSTALTDAPPVRPAFARTPVLVVASLTGAAHLLAAALGGGYYFDEAPVLAIARRHLAWGSADHPPLTPLLARLMDTIVPGGIVALRVPAVLATVAAAVLVGMVAHELGGDRRAQLIAAGAQATSPWAALSGHWLVPYSLEPAQWALLVWLLVRWVNRRDDRLLLAAGVVTGVAMLTKFQVGMLCAALVLAVAACGPRDVLRRPATWAAAVVTVLIATPTLLWQAAHGWPQLRMASVVAAEGGILYGGRPGVAVLSVLVAGVPGAVLAVYGLVRLLRGTDLRAYRFVGVAFVLLWVVIVATAGRFYYLAGLVGVGVAAGAVGLQRRREVRRGSGRRPRRAWPWFAVGVVTAAAALGASVLTVNPTVPTAIADRTGAAYRALPDGQRDRAAVVADSSITAGYLEVHGDGFPVYSGSRAWGYFDPPPPDTTTVVWSGGDPAALRPWFTDVRPVDDGVWLATGPTAPWSEIWPGLRTLTAG